MQFWLLAQVGETATQPTPEVLTTKEVLMNPRIFWDGLFGKCGMPQRGLALWVGYMRLRAYFAAGERPPALRRRAGCRRFLLRGARLRPAIPVKGAEAVDAWPIPARAVSRRRVFVMLAISLCIFALLLFLRPLFTILVMLESPKNVPRVYTHAAQPLHRCVLSLPSQSPYAPAPIETHRGKRTL